MAPRPSNALVLWDSNPTGVHTQEDLSVAVRGRWAIILKAFMSPSPGRTLDRIYTSLGRVLERHANRTAHSLGLGPHAVAQKIKSFFDNGEERVQRLELLRTAVPPKLQKRCLKLFEYTLPTESSEMQCQAFRDIVDLVTLFPGLRILFLPATPSDIATLRDTISTLWDHSTGTPNAEWTFWKTLASTCLTETTISAILDERSVSDLCDCQEGGLSVIEQLLLEHDSSGASIYSRTLCIRYLGGILDLPGFWLNFNTRTVHSHVANKLCSGMVRILKDIGIDILVLGPLTESESAMDYDGVDFLATTFLTQIQVWFLKSRRKKWPRQPWYTSFKEFLQLLRRPRAAQLLPHSSATATSATYESILPTVYQIAEVTIVEAREYKERGNQDTIRNASLADLESTSNSTSSVQSHSEILYEEDGRQLYPPVDHENETTKNQDRIRKRPPANLRSKVKTNASYGKLALSDASSDEQIVRALAESIHNARQRRKTSDPQKSHGHNSHQDDVDVRTRGSETVSIQTPRQNEAVIPSTADKDFITQLHSRLSDVAAASRHRLRQVPSWATWEPDPDLAPSPPSREAPLLMPENTSPGLFGPRSAQESRYGYGLHMIKPTSPSKRRPEAAASSGSRRHVPARATRKFGSDMASTPPLRERTGRRRAAAPGPDRGSQIQSWATWQPESALALIPPILEPTPWVLSQQHTAAPVPEPLSNVPAWMTWRPNPHYNLAPTPPSRDTTARVSHPRDVATPDPSLTPTPSLNEAALMEPGDYSPGLFGPSSSRESDASLTTTLPLQEAGLMEPGDYSPGPFGPRSPQLELPADSPSPQSPSVQFPNPPLSRDPDVPAWMTWRPNPALAPAPPLAHPTQRVLSRERRSVFPAPSPRPLMVPETESPGLSGPMSPPLRERTREPVLDKPLSPATVPAWMTWRNNPALSPAPPLAHPTQRVLSHERPSAFPAPSPRPPMVPETGSPGLFGPRSPPFTSRFSDY